jgi:outer membrane receptor protein involved in Fe transport
MTRIVSFGSLLLLSSALVAPAAIAQGTGGAQGTTTTPAQTATPGEATAQEADDPEQEIEVSAPGADAEDEEIVVVGRNIPNAIRSTPEVISVLSTEDIARTGEGDIAGALQRVTGLSVVGNGFVFVRGLGDRYSLALLNGSPLPSPEPLRRVVPLDIFPTSVIASAVVQKSYSVNYPGEFGGGVINLTSASIPREPFLSFGVSGQVDTDTTGRLGYTYEGSNLDFLGFDDGTRDFPTALRQAVTSGTFGQTSAAQRRDFAASLRNAETTVVQTNRDIPANISADASGGYTWEISDGRIGVIGAAGYSSNWRTRDTLQQTSLDPQLGGIPQTNFNTVITDNRVVVNGLLGLGAEFGKHEIRWTNLYIRDTLKQARLASGFNRSVRDPDPSLPNSVIEQNTYFFERQLIDTQLVGEFKFGDFSLDLRGTYANSQRESPYERDISYTYQGDGNPATKSSTDVDDYINNLSSIGQSANVAFNDLEENVYAGGVDVAYRLGRGGSFPTTVSAGYAYNKTDRTASRFPVPIFPPGRRAADRDRAAAAGFPAVRLQRLHVQHPAARRLRRGRRLGLRGRPRGQCRLCSGRGRHRRHRHPCPVRRPLRGCCADGASGRRERQPDASCQRLLPARRDADLQFRREHAAAPACLQDHRTAAVPGTRTADLPGFRIRPRVHGNPFLQDSELFNAEARYEWYFARGQRFSLSGFYKRIDNPIEAAAFFAGGGQLRTGFANAPAADLYGAEVELQYYLPLESLGGFFSTRRLLLIGNYTYTQSKLKVDDSQIVGPDLQPVAANLLFRDGAPLTGQSDHLANLQIGIEDTDRISQVTLLMTYASDRVTNRGPIQGSLRQPDITEKPGFRLDLVAREQVKFLGADAEIRFEARNLLRQDYEEFQKFEDRRIDINRYDLGATFSLGISFNL